MQKIKNLLHHNHQTASTSNSNLDRNHDGRVDANEARLGSRNPLDRNGDGKVDLKDLSGSSMNRPAVPANELAARKQVHDELLRGNAGLRHAEPARLDSLNLDRSGLAQGETFYNQEPVALERVQKETVVHEHIHPVEKEEIQPVIFREREQLDIKQITQQLHETQIQPTLIQQRELAPEVRAPIVERAIIEENIVLPSYDLSATERSVQVNAPIVNETIKKTVIEEVQPVLERDVIAPTLIQETLPIYEKIVEAPVVFREVLPSRELGTRSTGFEQSFVGREAPLAAPLAAPVQMSTTTTTTDTFVPAKLVKGEYRNTTSASPLGRKVL